MIMKNVLSFKLSFDISIFNPLRKGAKPTCFRSPIILILLFLFCFSFPTIYAQKITLDKPQYLLGDTVNIKVKKSNSSNDEEIKIIDLSKFQNLTYQLDTNKFEQYADVEILRVSNDTLIKGNKIILNPESEFDLVLRIYSLGAFKLLQNENDTTIILIDDLDSLNVQSDIKDILPIFEDESINWTWLYYVIGFIILMAIAFYIFKNKDKFKKQKPTPTATLKPQYLMTLEALEKIKLKSWTLEEAKAFQSELTEVLRKYISHYFDKNAMSITSHELVKSMNNKLKNENLLNDLSEMFSIADLVKFAKATPDVGLFIQTVDKAMNFVKETRPEIEQ